MLKLKKLHWILIILIIISIVVLAVTTFRNSKLTPLERNICQEDSECVVSQYYHCDRCITQEYESRLYQKDIESGKAVLNTRCASEDYYCICSLNKCVRETN